MKNLGTIIEEAIIAGMQGSDPEANWHMPGRLPGSTYIEGSFAMDDVAKHVSCALAAAFSVESKRYEGAPSGGELMNIYRDMSRIFGVK